MMRGWRPDGWLEADDELDGARRRPAPGKVTLTQRLEARSPRLDGDADAGASGQAWLSRTAAAGPAVQLAAADEVYGLHLPAARVHEVAAAGVEGHGQPLPHGDEIQRRFGRHDVSGVRAHVGGAAADASRALGARAYATGSQVAFAASPDLHTAAHEAAHVVQQRAGVQLRGDVGAVGDRYEQHADAVADAVVRGESAEALLDQLAGGGGGGGGGRAAAAVQRQATGMGEVRAREGADGAAEPPAAAGAAGSAGAADASRGPEAAFLRQLTADKLLQAPRPLRVERDRPAAVTLIPTSDLPLPLEAPRLPVWCKLVGADRRSVAEAGGQWHPGLVTGPVLTLTVPRAGAYVVEVHVNAGRPGARVLRRRLAVEVIDADTAAGDAGAHVRAATARDRSATPPVETYRDLLAIVMAARALTEEGDAEAYRHAARLLAPAQARLQAIFPRALDLAGDYGYARNLIQQRLDGAIAELRVWQVRLTLGSRIATEPVVARFRAAERPIMLGTGELQDDAELRALDDAVPVASAAGVGAIGAGAAAAVATATLAKVIAAGGASGLGARITVWAASDPAFKLFVAEVLVGMGLSIGDRGVEEYFGQIEDSEDLVWAIYQAAVDAMQARQGRLATGGPVGVPDPAPLPGRRPGQPAPGPARPPRQRPARPAPEVEEAPKEKTRGVPSAQLSERGRNNPTPLPPEDLAKLEDYEASYRTYLKVTREQDSSRMPKPTRDLLEGSADNAIANNMTPDDLSAVLRENRGEVIAKPDGTPYNHVEEFDGARNSILNTLDAIDRRLKKLSGHGAPGEVEALGAKRKALSDILDLYEEIAGQ